MEKIMNTLVKDRTAVAASKRRSPLKQKAPVNGSKYITMTREEILALVEPLNRFQAKEGEELKSVAYHEAGHAVMAVNLHLTPTRASIKPDGDTLGHAGYLSYEDDYSSDPIVQLLFAKAGMIAEVRADCFGKGFMAVNDMIKVAEIMDREFPEDSERAMVDISTGITWKILDRSWSSVEAVAKALLEKETLKGEEIYKICRKGGRKILTIHGFWSVVAETYTEHLREYYAMTESEIKLFLKPYLGRHLSRSNNKIRPRSVTRADS